MARTAHGFKFGDAPGAMKGVVALRALRKKIAHCFSSVPTVLSRTTIALLGAVVLVAS
jgi:hypothetical protein